MLFQIETEFGTLIIKAKSESLAAKYVVENYGAENILKINIASESDLEYNNSIIEVKE